MRAERCLRVGRDRAALWGLLGVHVVDFTWFSPNRETSRLRLERAFWVITRQRSLLVRSSGVDRLFLCVRRHPQSPGSRVAHALVKKIKIYPPAQEFGQQDAGASCTSRARPGHDEPPWHAARRCESIREKLGSLPNAEACASCGGGVHATESMSTSTRLEVWQDERLARPGRAGWGRLNGAKCAHSAPALGPSALRKPPTPGLPPSPPSQVATRPAYSRPSGYPSAQQERRICQRGWDWGGG